MLEQDFGRLRIVERGKTTHRGAGERFVVEQIAQQRQQVGLGFEDQML